MGKADVYLQKPSMQSSPGAQFSLAVGSHSPPKFSFEPQTRDVPAELSTSLQTLKDERLSQAPSWGASQLT